MCLGSGSYSGGKTTPLCSRVVHLMLSSSFFGASHHRYSSPSSSSASSLASFLALTPFFEGVEGSALTLPLTFFDDADFDSGMSLSESSFFVLLFFVNVFLTRGTSLSDSSFFT